MKIENIENDTQKMKYKMNNFNYINTLKRKRDEQFSNNKNNIKKLMRREDSFPSCLGARQVRYALRYHACIVSGVNSLINKCLNMNWLPH